MTEEQFISILPLFRGTPKQVKAALAPYPEIHRIDIGVIRKILVYDGIVFLTDCEFDWEMPRNVNRNCIVKARGGRGNIPAWCKFGMEMDDLLRGVA